MGPETHSRGAPSKLKVERSNVKQHSFLLTSRFPIISSLRPRGINSSGKGKSEGGILDSASSNQRPIDRDKTAAEVPPTHPLES